MAVPPVVGDSRPPLSCLLSLAAASRVVYPYSKVDASLVRRAPRGARRLEIVAGLGI
jgi:hypothetical protein